VQNRQASVQYTPFVLFVILNLQSRKLDRKSARGCTTTVDED
jgi:hypothetical protein